MLKGNPKSITLVASYEALARGTRTFRLQADLLLQLVPSFVWPLSNLGFYHSMPAQDYPRLPHVAG